MNPLAGTDVSADEIRHLARQAAADLEIPLEQVNLLRLAYWLARQSKACTEAA